MAPFDGAKAKAAQESWAKSLGKSGAIEKNSIDMELVLIPPGSFRMGSAAQVKERSADETQVEVTLTRPFYLGRTEVTQCQWQAVMGTTPWKGKEKAREGDSLAATYVNWEDAMEFCKALSDKENATYRLPTEAEWEFACSAGASTKFSFGDDEAALPKYAWWANSSDDANTKEVKYVHEVGRKLPNPFGLYDTHGNVWEWCDDMYDRKLPGGTDPLVTEGENQVIRGGGWSSQATMCRCAYRNWGPAAYRVNNVGFRVARSVAR